MRPENGIRNDASLSISLDVKEMKPMFGNGNEGENNKKKRIIFTVGTKGGVGKTLFVRSLFFWLKLWGVRVIGVDADAENQEFYAYHRGLGNLNELGIGKVEVYQIDMKQNDIAAKFFDLLSSKDEEKVFLVDMPGASTREMQEIFESFSLVEVAEELGFRVTLTVLLNSSPLMSNMVSNLLEEFGESVDYVVVKNSYFAKGENSFSYWDNSLARDSIMKMEGCEIVMPILKGPAAETLSGNTLSFFEMDKLIFSNFLLTKSFLDKCVQSYEKAGEKLGFNWVTRRRELPFSIKNQAQVSKPKL